MIQSWFWEWRPVHAFREFSLQVLTGKHSMLLRMCKKEGGWSRWSIQWRLLLNACMVRLKGAQDIRRVTFGHQKTRLLRKDSKIRLELLIIIIFWAMILALSGKDAFGKYKIWRTAHQLAQKKFPEENSPIFCQSSSSFQSLNLFFRFAKYCRKYKFEVNFSKELHPH